MTSLSKNWRLISRDGHGIKLAYYLPAYKGGQGLRGEAP